MKTSEIDSLVNLLRDVASDEIMPRFRRLDPSSIDTKSSADDLVTIADRAAEARIADALKTLMPRSLVIGEESATQDSRLVKKIATAKRAVIVDPIDGTWNFVNGVPCFGSILAVTERGKTVFGVILMPRCSAHEYRLLAQGSFKFLLSINPKPWDHAAGTLILAEGGGFVSHLNGESYEPGQVNGPLVAAVSKDSLIRANSIFYRHWNPILQ